MTLRLGLLQALHGLADQMNRSGVATRLDGEMPASVITQVAARVVLQVVRELCRNVQKHARAHHAFIAILRHEQRWGICVTDDGRGFDAQQVLHGAHGCTAFGLVGADAQMQAIGGQLEIDSSAGQGTCATAVLPASPPSRSA